MSSLNLITNGDFNTPLDASNTEYSFGWNNGQVYRDTYFKYYTSGVMDAVVYVNGGTSATQAFWKQSVNLTAGQAYTFSYQVMCDTYKGPGKIQLSVNDSLIGTPYEAGLASTWTTVTFDFIATQSGNQTIQLKNPVITNAGDEFFIDKLSLVANGPVDTKAPTVSTVTDTTSANVTNGPITFTVTFDEAVVGTVGTNNFTASNGTVTSVTPVSGTNAYTVVVTPNAGVASGNVALSLVGTGLKDAAGNAVVDADLSSKDSQAIDTVAPTTAPTLSLAASSDGGTKGDNLTNVTTPTLTGKAEANAWVSVYANGSNTAMGKVQANASGDWNYTVGTALAHGTTTSFTAQQADAAGNTSALSAALAVKVDTTAAAAPVLLSNAVGMKGQYLRIYHSDATSAVGLTGLKVMVGGVDIIASLNAAGIFTADNITASADGQSAREYKVSWRPAALLDTQFGNAVNKGVAYIDNYTPNSKNYIEINLGAVYNIDSLMLWGISNAAAASQNLRVFVSKTAPVVSATAYTTLQTATDTSYVDVATVTTSADATGTNGTQVSTLNAKYLSPITNTTRPPLSGTGEAGATVDIFDTAAKTTDNPNGNIGSAVVKADGTWSFQPANMAQGSHSITTQQTDVAGNKSGLSSAYTFLVDTTAPVVSTVTDNVAGVANSAISFTVTFDEAVASTVSTKNFTATNGTVTSVTPVSGTNAYTVVVTPTAGLASGNVALSLVGAGLMDAAGNAVVTADLSSKDSQAIDTKAPVVSTVTDNVAGVANSAITFTVTFDEAVVGTVGTSSFTATNGTVTLVTPVSGTNAYNVIVSPKEGLASGNVALTLVGTGLKDAAGNAVVTTDLSSKDSQAVDTLAPATAPTFALATGSDSGTKGDNLTNVTTPTLTGKAEANAWVSVYANGSNTALGKVQANASGDWNYTVGTALAHGTTTSFTAQQADAAGNTSALSAALAVKVDTTAAAAPVLLSNAVGMKGQYLRIYHSDATSAVGLTGLKVMVGGVDIISSLNAAGIFTADNITASADGQSAREYKVSWRPAALLDTQFGNAVNKGVAYIDNYTPNSKNYIEINLGAVYNIDSLMLWGISNAAAASQNLRVFVSKTAPVVSATAYTTLQTAADTSYVDVATVTTSADATGTNGTQVSTLNTKYLSPTTNTTRPPLSGTGEAGATVDIFDTAAKTTDNPNGNIGSAVVKADGTWSFQPANMAQGSHSITTQQTDVAGNKSGLSSAYAFIVDTTAPVVSTVTDSTSADITKDPISFTVTFDEAVASTVSTKNFTATNGTVTSVTPVSGTNAYTVVVTPTAGLASGNVALRLVGAGLMDAAGNAVVTADLSSKASQAVDTLAPTTAPTLSLAASSDSGTKGDNITHVTTPTLTGKAEANAWVSVYANGSNTALGKVQANASGDWNYTVGTALSHGTTRFTAQQADAAGNTSPTSAALAVTVDSPVAAPALLANAVGMKGQYLRIYHSDATSAVGLTGLKVMVGGVDIISSLNAAGIFTADNITASADGQSAREYKVSWRPAALLDTQFGNAVNKGVAYIDNYTPNSKNYIEINLGAVYNIDSLMLWGISNNPLSSQNLRVFVSKTAPVVSATAYTTLQTAADTSYVDVATVTTSADATGTNGTQVSTLDTKYLSPTTNTTRPPLSGTGEAGATVDIFDTAAKTTDNPNGNIGSAVVKADGTWSFQPANMAQGSHSITTQQTDVAGNKSGLSSAYTFIVDTTAPVVSTVTDSTSADITKDPISFTVTFDEAVASAVSTKNFTATNGTVTSVTPVSGTNAYTVVVTPTAGLASGNVALRLVGAGLMDAAGNAVVTADLSSKASQAIDTLAPSAPEFITTSVFSGQYGGPAIKYLPGAVTQIAYSGSVNDLSPASLTDGSLTSIYGAVWDGSGYAYKVMPNTYFQHINTSVPGELTFWAAGYSSTRNLTTAFKFKLVDVLTGGYTLQQIDWEVYDGNWTDGKRDMENTRGVAVHMFYSNIQTLSFRFNANTDETNPMLYGTGEVGATVDIFETVDGNTSKLGSAVVKADGNWRFSAGNLTSGSHTVVIQQTDSAGNKSPLSSGHTFTVADVLMGSPTLDADSDSGLLGDAVTNVTAPTLKGTSISTGDGVKTVQVFDNGTLLGTAIIDNGAKTWSLTPSSSLNSGVHSITVKDVAADQTSRALSLTIDTVCTTPTLNAVADTRTAPVITGTGEVGATIVLTATPTDGTATQTYTALVNVSGTWSVDTGAAQGSNALLPGKTYALFAIATDVAGNTGRATAVEHVLYDNAMDAQLQRMDWRMDQGTKGQLGAGDVLRLTFDQAVALTADGLPTAVFGTGAVVAAVEPVAGKSQFWDVKLGSGQTLGGVSAGGQGSVGTALSQSWALTGLTDVLGNEGAVTVAAGSQAALTAQVQAQQAPTWQVGMSDVEDKGTVVQGWAAPGAKLRLNWGGQETKDFTADAQGYWSATFYKNESYFGRKVPQLNADQTLRLLQVNADTTTTTLWTQTAQVQSTPEDAPVALPADATARPLSVQLAVRAGRSVALDVRDATLDTPSGTWQVKVSGLAPYQSLNRGSCDNAGVWTVDAQDWADLRINTAINTVQEDRVLQLSYQQKQGSGSGATWLTQRQASVGLSVLPWMQIPAGVPTVDPMDFSQVQQVWNLGLKGLSGAGINIGIHEETSVDINQISDFEPGNILSGTRTTDGEEHGHIVATRAAGSINGPYVGVAYGANIKWTYSWSDPARGMDVTNYSISLSSLGNQAWDGVDVTQRNGLGNVWAVAGSNSNGNLTALLKSTKGVTGITVAANNPESGGWVFLSTGPALWVAHPAWSTSEATASVSGQAAMMLQANPGLGTRDVKNILALSAGYYTSDTPLSTFDINHARNLNGAGAHFSNQVGFGVINAFNAVRLATDWLADGSAPKVMKSWQTNSATVATTPVSVAAKARTASTISVVVTDDVKLEAMQIMCNISSDSFNKIRMVVTSPSGTVSELVNGPKTASINEMLLMTSNKFFGESSKGTWTVSFEFISDATSAGTVSNLYLQMFGAVNEVDDKYVYTDQFGLHAQLADAHTEAQMGWLSDLNGGNDSLMLSAMNTDVQVHLGRHGWMTSPSFKVLMSPGTRIENAFGGDGNDVLVGLANGKSILRGNEGSDVLLAYGAGSTLDGGNADDWLWLGGDTSAVGGQGNDRFVVFQGETKLGNTAAVRAQISDFDATQDSLMSYDTAGNYKLAQFDASGVLTGWKAVTNASVLQTLRDQLAQSDAPDVLGVTVSGTTAAPTLTLQWDQSPVHAVEGYAAWTLNGAAPASASVTGQNLSLSYTGLSSGTLVLDTSNSQLYSTLGVKMPYQKIYVGSTDADTLDASGQSNAVALFGQGGADTLQGGSGADLLAASTGAQVRMSGGAGADVFKIQSGGTGGRLELSDFSLSQGDRLDLDALLQTIGNTNFVEDCVQITRTGNDAVLAFDLTGSKNFSTNAFTVELDNVYTQTTDITLRTLTYGSSMSGVLG